VAPRGLAQLLHWPGCHTVDCGLQLQEAAIGKARTRIGLQTAHSAARARQRVRRVAVCAWEHDSCSICCCCVTCLPRALGGGSCWQRVCKSVPASKEAVRRCRWVVATWHGLGGCLAGLLCSREWLEATLILQSWCSAPETAWGARGPSPGLFRLQSQQKLQNRFWRQLPVPGCCMRGMEVWRRQCVRWEPKRGEGKVGVLGSLVREARERSRRGGTNRRGCPS
jgi:hypothetical protein